MTQYAWGAQSVVQTTLGFGSGHDLRVMSSSPIQALCSAPSLLKTLDLSPSPSRMLSCSLSLSLSLSNKGIFFKNDPQYYT